MPTLNSPEPIPSPILQGDQSFRRLAFLAAIAILFLTATFFIIQYDRSRQSEAGMEAWYQTKVAGVLNEGDQYRIGLPYLAHFLKVHTPLAMHQSIPLIQSVCYGAGLICLYLLLIRSTRFRVASTLQRTADVGFFLGAVQLPILWIFPWERPETLPTFCYVAAASLLILETQIPLALSCVLAVLLSFVQALNRTDAPMVVGLAALLASVTIPLYRRRGATALLGALCFATSAATQLYLRRLFPDTHPTQRATTFQLFYNFSPRYPFVPYRLPAFILALIPLLVTLTVLRYRSQRLDPTDKFTLLVALLYLPMYMAFGIISEVRIYVPYLFLLAPFIAKVWTAFSIGEVTQPRALRNS